MTYSTPKLTSHAASNPFLQNVALEREVENPTADNVTAILTDEESLIKELTYALGQVMGMVDCETLTEAQRVEMEEYLLLTQAVMGL